MIVISSWATKFKKKQKPVQNLIIGVGSLNFHVFFSKMKNLDLIPTQY